MSRKKAIIIGAGPAGLTAAFELLKTTSIMPVIYEQDEQVGGISKTVHHNGNRMDIGGHRFFSKSDKVMNFWLKVLPMQGKPARDDLLLGRTPVLNPGGPDPEKEERVILSRNRLSRILFLRKFFDYPLTLNLGTVRNLGLFRLVRAAFSYFRIRLFPIKHEKTLEDFFINRFGRELYETFFKDYTFKVWGIPCNQIAPDWGVQRVRGLSATKTITHALKKIFFRKKISISQKDSETSLIEHFLYPKYGPGQLWEEVARQVESMGGVIRRRYRLERILVRNWRISSVRVRDLETQEVFEEEGDFFFSSMPVKDLIESMGEVVPRNVREVASGLLYRDFITVGLLLKKLKINNGARVNSVNGIVPDNWIYVQERDVKVGRLQIFNNWSPYMVKDVNTVWIGLEYFCKEGDDLWTMGDSELIRFAAEELEKIGMIDGCDVLDAKVIRVPKAYPAYFGTYDQFGFIRDYTDLYDNLFLIGRNGMHRYNNMDHSMLSAMQAVEAVRLGSNDKAPIWAVNADEEYHETADK